jgi:hypothetical protein
VSNALSAPAPAKHEDDSRARAARRAAELREHIGDSDNSDDKFYIPPEIIPEGWEYQWKRHTLLGKQDPSYEVQIATKGWEAVPCSRHRFMMPEGHSGETIEREGMILMEVPKEIADAMRARELRKARDQVGDKEKQLGAAPPGQFERDKHPNTRPNISKSFQSIPIPEK